jgi:hypothetical protein
MSSPKEKLNLNNLYSEEIIDEFVQKKEYMNMNMNMNMKMPSPPKLSAIQCPTPDDMPKLSLE